MTRFRKKPVEVQTVRYVGPDNIEHEAGWTRKRSSAVANFLGFTNCRVNPDDSLTFWIAKSQADGTIQPGDWIIAEPDGHGFYPCTAADFEQTYEPVLPTEESST